MSRPESVALGGYYPTPPCLLPSIAALVSFDFVSAYIGGHVAFDPCAGTGEAIAELRKEWAGEYARRVRIAACEMEASRHRLLTKLLSEVDQAVHGDAFALTWTGAVGCSVLYLNPPYDTDPDHGRLEQRFLSRFAGALAPGGALIFVLPAHALGTSAAFLATHFTEIRAWRFPEEEYAAFKQVVLTARRLAAPLVAAPMAATISAWATYPLRLPVLPERCPDPLRVPRGTYGLPLHRADIDLTATLAAFRPWEGMPVGTAHSVADMVGGRTFPTALPPKPAHLAMMLAAGHFNGERIDPDDSASGMPPLLIKGMYRTELVEVDRKLDKAGELKAIVKIQRASLEVSALRLDSFQFFSPGSGSEPSGAVDVEQCNIRDIVERYGRSFAGISRRQFPALHDPAKASHQMRLPELARPLFRAQAHAVQASLKLLAGGEHPKFVAEVGVGKTSCALALFAFLSPRYRPAVVAELERVGFARSRVPTVRRMLVLCPTHLLSTWEEEAEAVVPWARVKVVRKIADLRDEAEIYVLSKETAKLGHGYRGVGEEANRARRETGRCPKCGAGVPDDAETNAERRRICRAPVRVPWNGWAKLAEDLAAALLPAMPDNDLVTALIGRRRTLARRTSTPPGRMDRDAILRIMGLGGSPGLSILRELPLHLSKAAGYQERRLPVAAFEDLARVVGAERVAAAALRNLIDTTDNRSGLNVASEAIESLRSYPTPDAAEKLALCRQALTILLGLGRWEGRPEYKLSRRRQGPRERVVEGEGDDKPAPAEICGEPLYWAVPEPRRFPLAKYISRYMRDRFDLLVLDEVQDYSNQGTAQELAAHRLAELRMPVLALSGSVMSGYASSLFANWFSLDRRFRQEFAREDGPEFVRRYGFRKFEFKPKEVRGRRGRVTDREEMSCRDAGQIPGVLPLFLLRYLLPAGIVVHKDEMDRELPPMSEAQVELHAETDMDAEMLGEYRRITEIMLARIAADMFTPLSGKLWGAMGVLTSYPDRCTEDLGPFELRYPKDCGGMLVAEGRLFPASYRTPKEKAMLAFVREELRAERRVVLALHHVNSALPRRILRLLQEEGVTDRAVYLSAQAVPAPVRKQWITDHVVKPGVEVLVVNPETIKTGLNNLVHFATAWWQEMEPGRAQTYRQACGRLHRYGQQLPVHVRVPVYPGTAQAVAIDLTARKVTASLGVDALDIQGALEASGGEVSGRAAVEAAMAVGKAIYERLRSATH